MLTVGSIGLFPTHSSEYTYVTDLEGSIVWNWSCEGGGAEAVNICNFHFCDFVVTIRHLCFLSYQSSFEFLRDGFVPKPHAEEGSLKVLTHYHSSVFALIEYQRFIIHELNRNGAIDLHTLCGDLFQKKLFVIGKAFVKMCDRIVELLFPSHLALSSRESSQESKVELERGVKRGFQNFLGIRKGLRGIQGSDVDANGNASKEGKASQGRSLSVQVGTIDVAAHWYGNSFHGNGAITVNDAWFSRTFGTETACSTVQEWWWTVIGDWRLVIAVINIVAIEIVGIVI